LEHFAQVPRWLFGLLEGRTISKRQFVVAAAIFLHYNPKRPHDCFPSVRRLAKLTGFGERHVREDISVLEARGAMMVVRATGRVNHYLPMDAARRQAIKAAREPRTKIARGSTAEPRTKIGAEPRTETARVTNQRTDQL
jgi:hypothetical protein